MNKTKTIFDDWADPMKFSTMSVGYPEIMDRFKKSLEDSSKVMQSNWPPYNIKKTADNKYVIELAVAGFPQSSLDVEVASGVLTITGKADKTDENVTYEHQGIAARDFIRKFSLIDQVEVKSADLTNGMLSIWLDMITPEENKVKVDIKTKDKS